MKPPPEMIAALKARAEALGPIPLKEQMFREAVGFHESAQRNFEQRVGPDGRYSFPFTAGVVGLAFASELYLKTLHVLAGGKAPHGHKLNVLFSNLPRETKRLVKLRYEQRRKGTGAVLEGDLIAYANAFVEFRYIYDAQSRQMDVIGLGQLASSLYETCRRLHPDLPNYGDYTHIRITSAAQGMPIFSAGAHPYPPGPPWSDERGSNG